MVIKGDLVEDETRRAEEAGSLVTAAGGPTRRAVLLQAAVAAAGSAISVPVAGQPRRTTAVSSFVRVAEEPSSVTVFLEATGERRLERAGETWGGGGCAVTFERTAGGRSVRLSAGTAPVERVRVRWAARLPVARLRVLGDAWERSYGELGWREVVPERPLPWYFLTHDGESTHGYGVLTGAAAFAFWQCDAEGVTLWLDVRNGGRGVVLGARSLAMATIVEREGQAGESPMAAARALCRQMCPRPRAAGGSIYGSNDWYYAYGKNTAEGILRDADVVAELSPGGRVRPFTVVDDGWEKAKGFPDMAGLAAGIRAKGVRPGIWIRPLLAEASDPRLLLPGARFKDAKDAGETPAFDPTLPEALEHALARVREARSWGYELIKHDFSTYDLLGQWGFAMEASPALPGWSFHERTRTSAEIVRSFYEAIRREAGGAVVIGCNTVGHLAAGVFEGQRIGDDVSGRVWERTRRMGVNALAFRLPQHGTFFCADPDCVPVTAKIRWERTRQWMEVVARSGAAMMISPEPGSVGPEQKLAIREAFAMAAAGGAGASPADWLETHTPAVWEGSGRRRAYRWLEPQGAWPFAV